VSVSSNIDSNEDSKSSVTAEVSEQQEQNLAKPPPVLQPVNGVADQPPTPLPPVAKQQNTGTNQQPNVVESATDPDATEQSPQEPLVEACFVCMKESTTEEPLTLCSDCNLIYYCGDVHRDIHRPHDTCFPFIVRSSQKAAGR
jgi:hypothetical protein